MDTRQQRTVGRFHGALSWLEKSPIDPEPPLLAGMRESLRKSLRRIADFERAQVSQPTDGSRVTERRMMLRRRRMIPLRDIARPLIRWAPGEAAALHVPRADASAATVAAAALRMTDALMPHAKLLRSAGISKDYLRQMRQEARGLALLASSRRSSRANRSRATRGIAAEISKALHTLGVIGGMVAIHAPDELGTWKKATGVQAPVGRPRQPRRRRRPDTSRAA